MVEEKQRDKNFLEQIFGALDVKNSLSLLGLIQAISDKEKSYGQ